MSTPEHLDPPAERAAAPSPLDPSPLDPAHLDPAPAPAAVRAADEPLRRDREDRAPAADTFPVPTGPKTTSVGGHLLGILVGLVLALVGSFLVTLGQSRIIADGVGQTDVTVQTFGIVLVTLGALVFAIVVLLGLWTPAAPFTGGLLAVLVGAAYLFAPVAAHRETVRLLSTEQNRVAVLNSISAGTTGGLFVIGIVLLAVATALAMVRRRGLELGAFRERRQGTTAAH